LKNKIYPTLRNNQTSPSHATQETNLWISHIPKKITSPNPFKKTPPLERGGITSSSPPYPTKTFLKKKILGLSSPFS
jgi:hypothetical protein